MTEKDSTIILRAAEVIAARGWAQGNYENPNGCVCAFGALNIVIAGGPNPTYLDIADEDDDRLTRLGDLIYRTANPEDDFLGLASWNDARGRTKDEVIDAFVRAAERLKAEGR